MGRHLFTSVAGAPAGADFELPGWHMDREIRSWMVGVGFEAEGVEAPVIEKVTLSTGQKRELAGLTGLVMASTVFFLTPLVVSAPEPSLELAALERTAVPLAVPVAAHAPVPTPAPEAIASPGRNRTAAPRAPGGSRARAAVPLAPSRALVIIAVAPPPPALMKNADPARRKGPNGLVRALVGSGRYRVQPFPTPTSGD